MKTFSDLLAIDHKIDFFVCLEPVSDNGNPEFWVSINGKNILQGYLTNSIEKHHAVDLLDPIRVEIGMKGKRYSALQETAIIIKSIQIDGFEIVPNWTHLAVYKNDHDDESPTSYLGYNGTWILDIPISFYRWKHQITGQGWLLEPARSLNS
jgi:hypothetical protein